MFLVTQNSCLEFVIREAGGKGYNLYLLTKAGYNVPPWVGIGISIFQRFLTDTGLKSQIIDFLDQAVVDQNWKNCSENIKQRIFDTKIPIKIQEIIVLAYQKLDVSSIAIRSSAQDEDSAQYSFAGQNSSFLFIETENDVLLKIKECWASAFSERSLFYRFTHNISLRNTLNFGVVFQKMVESEKSGVTFTQDPINKNKNQIVINSLYGMGEALVSGLLEPDMYFIDKETKNLDQKTLSNKYSKLIKNEFHELVQESIGITQQNVSSLNESEINELSQLAESLENHFNYPQDIEWAIKNDSIYILQTRPLTTVKPIQKGTLRIWDNSNIVESYGGITKPLTFTFAQYVYSQVYDQLCKVLLVPEFRRTALKPYLDHMLGIFYGRIYYNLLNWYRLLTIIPGFTSNRSFMENMMGVDKKLEDEIASELNSSELQSSIILKMYQCLSGIRLLWFHFFSEIKIQKFLKYFQSTYEKFLDFDYNSMSAHQIYSYHLEVEKRLLCKWQEPLLNDLLCMIHFGILKKLCLLWLPQHSVSLCNDLLAEDGHLESAKPTLELLELAEEIKKNPLLFQLINETSIDNCSEALEQSNFQEFKLRIKNYIRLYGFRCMNEMKLEEKDLHQDSRFLYICLKNYLKSDLQNKKTGKNLMRKNAEIKVSHALSILKKPVFYYFLKHARRSVKNRELTRFCRTRIYGIIRSMYFGLGTDFTRRKMISEKEDIFYLTVQELKGIFDAGLTIQDLKPLITLRKNSYFEYAKTEPLNRFITRGPVYEGLSFDPFEKDTEQSNTNLENPNFLTGIGCSSGIVEGVVKIVLNPTDDLDLNGHILVTYRTDPGWIPLYPSISGLLVERGGLLSHSAIVAREMGVPTIVSIKNLTQILKNGMQVKINGEKGTIEIISDSPKEKADHNGNFF